MTLSTHILDTEIGEPAGGVQVGLYRGTDLISLQETDEDGRIGNLFDGPFSPSFTCRSLTTCFCLSSQFRPPLKSTASEGR